MRKETLMDRNQRLQKAQDFTWRNARLIERYLFALLYVGMQKPLGLVFPAALGWLYVLAGAWTALACWLFANRGWR